MRIRRVLLLGLTILAVGASWAAVSQHSRRAHAAAAANATDRQGTVDGDVGMSPAEYRFRMSQSAHWRACMLQR